MKFNFKFILIALVLTLVVIPFLFNLLFLWDAGNWSRGETSDWFTFYGNIFGGLIGGFFTYLALLLTFKEQKENKKLEMRPRIDIPHQNFEFIYPYGTNNYDINEIVIELNNIGGSLAKNIECKLSLPNYDDVITALRKNEKYLKINLENVFSTKPNTQKHNEYFNLLSVENGKLMQSFGIVKKEYNAEFLGTCLPLVVNHEAKSKYLLEYNVKNWINYIVEKRNYVHEHYNKKELFNINLEVKYSSDEYGTFQENFLLEWKYIGMTSENSLLKFRYIIKSAKE